MVAKNTEEMIQEAGMSAPRVTPAAIEACVASKHFFTAADGLRGTGVEEDNISVEMGLMTFCVLVLKNGYTVVGKSACVSPENYHKEIGNKIAYENALKEVWPLEGYLLQQELYEKGE